MFAPYFTAALAPDPVSGQAWWGYATAVAGLCLGVLSPVLGSAADATGAKKPWILTSCIVLAICSAALWLAAPGKAYAVPLALVAFGFGTVAAEVAAVFNNAMMARLVGGERLGRLSGTGWAVGYAGGLASLVLTLGFLAASPETGKTYFGLSPLFGLDPALREGDRVVGPLCALWLVVFVWPLFAFTPDAPREQMPLSRAIPEGMIRLKATIAEARERPSIIRFLLANLVYQDALVALFAFGGIYGTGVFGWGATELGLFGILLTITGTVGALIGGRIDDRVGARAVIAGSLGLLVLVCVGIVSVGRDHILFAIATEPAGPGGPMFGSLPEKVFVGLGLVIGAVAGPLQASSRSYLARLVPAEDAGRFFGLLAVSGKLTSFMAPLMVAIATQVTGTQAAGSAVLIAFFGVGLWLIAGIRRD